MMTYDYKEAVKDDIIDYIKSEIGFEKYTTIDKLRDAIYNLENEDFITGNASGSYTFSRYEAGENLIGNFDLLAEALNYYGMEFSGDEEASDVIIRCYLVNDCIDEAVAEIEDEYNEFWEEVDSGCEE